VNNADQIRDELLRLKDVRRGAEFQVDVDGQMLTAFPGETVAAVLLAGGKRVFNYAPDGTPRSYSCGIGRCFSCLVTIDDVPNVRACKTLARPGMKVQIGLREAKPE
jgi:aerobic-type carbon monoxide dehydrogenase small subunit (CoxS/CutS family)